MMTSEKTFMNVLSRAVSDRSNIPRRRTSSPLHLAQESSRVRYGAMTDIRSCRAMMLARPESRLCIRWDASAFFKAPGADADTILSKMLHWVLRDSCHVVATELGYQFITKVSVKTVASSWQRLTKINKAVNNWIAR